MIALITPDGAVTRLSDEQLLIADKLDRFQATYDHLSAIFGPDHREPGETPAWAILTPAGLVDLRYRGRGPADITPRRCPAAVCTWSILGPDYAAAAWITKVISRPAELGTILT